MSDAKLTSTLLNQELNTLHSQGEEWKSILYLLLGKDVRFNGLFELFEDKIANANTTDVLRLVRDKICDRVYLNELIALHPVELAYVLAVVRLNDSQSVIHKWVLNTFPKTLDVYKELRFSSCQEESCSYCSEQLNPKKALKQYFTYDTFK